MMRDLLKIVVGLYVIAAVAVTGTTILIPIVAALVLYGMHRLLMINR